MVPLDLTHPSVLLPATQVSTLPCVCPWWCSACWRPSLSPTCCTWPPSSPHPCLAGSTPCFSITPVQWHVALLCPRRKTQAWASYPPTCLVRAVCTACPVYTGPNFPVSHFSNPVSFPLHGCISVLPIGLKEPGKLGGKELGPKEAELNGGSGLTRAQLVDLWVQFGHMMDNLLFHIYLLFLATSVTMVLVLWNT